MNCQKILPLLQSYLDEELSQENGQMVNKHLKQCSSCRESLTGMEKLIKFLKELPLIKPTKELAKDILASLADLEPSPGAIEVKSSHKLIWASVGAVVSIFSLILLIRKLIKRGARLRTAENKALDLGNYPTKI